MSLQDRSGAFRVTPQVDGIEVSSFNPIPTTDVGQTFGINLQLTSYPVSFSGSGDNIVIATPCRVYRIFLVTSAATNLTFKDNTNTLSGALPFQSTASLVLDTPVEREPWFICNRSFVINSSQAVTVAGTVYVLI